MHVQGRACAVDDKHCIIMLGLLLLTNIITLQDNAAKSEVGQPPAPQSPIMGSCIVRIEASK